MRKLVLSGMKGRRKDTFLLSFVVALSFIFIITSTIFHSSSENTKMEERTAMFGSWDVGYLLANEETVEKLRGKEEIESLGLSRLLGNSETFGLVGTVNDELLELGNFAMYEGRMPEKDNEIALELSRLSYFPTDFEVGDTIPVEVVIPLYEREQYEIQEELAIKLAPALERIYGFENIIHDINNFDIRAMDFMEKEAKGELTLEDRFPIHWPSLIRYGYSDTNIINEQTLESFDGSKVIIKTSDMVMDVQPRMSGMTKDMLKELYGHTVPRPSGEKKDDSIATARISQHGHITRDMVVTGIIQNYSDLWDVDGEPLANAFVTEEAGRAFIDKGFLLTEQIDLSDYEAPENIFIGSNIPGKDFLNKYEDEFKNLKRNASAYPDTGTSSESTLTYGILAAIFLATIFAVFQIYLTQTRRRTRRMALLKSIGAVNEQIRSMLVWEAVYLLLFTLPVSIVLGLGISKLVLLFVSKYGNTVLNIYIDYKLTLAGIGMGIVAVFIGMIIPMRRSMKVPLIGSISTPVRKKTPLKGKLKEKKVDLDMKIQSFGRVSLRNIKYNKGKTLLTASLYTITSLVLLTSIFLSFIFFGDYIDQVIMTDKPAYGFEFNHAITGRNMPDFLDSFNDVEGISRLELYKLGQHAYLWHENIERNEVYKAFKDTLPHNLIDQHFGINDTRYVNLDDDNKYLVEDGIVTNIYGIDTEDPLYKRFEDALTLGQLDQDKFYSGKEVVVLLPIYGQGNGGSQDVEISDELASNTNQKNRMGRLLSSQDLFHLSYDHRYANEYSWDDSIAPGDTLHLTVPTEDMEGEIRKNDVRFVEVEVAGIIHYFPDQGIWPFAATVENPVVIGSYHFLGDTHPSTITGKGSLPAEYIDYLIQAKISPNKYGRTQVYIYGDKNLDEVDFDVGLKRIARENQARLINYKEENKSIFNKAFNMASIIVILGISVAVITLIILYNTTLSKLEQERERIGLFQALGVTRGQFKKLYLFSGITYGILSLLISHIVLGLAVALTYMGGRPDPLYLYPWKIHISISIVVFIIISLTYYMPIRTIIENQPIDNIRSLGR